MHRNRILHFFYVKVVFIEATTSFSLLLSIYELKIRIENNDY